MNTIVSATPLGPRFTKFFDGGPHTHYRWVPDRPSKIIGIELYYYLEKGQTIESITVGHFEQLVSKLPAAYFRCYTPALVGSFKVACHMGLDYAIVEPDKPFAIVFSEPIAPLAIHYREMP